MTKQLSTNTTPSGVTTAAATAAGAASATGGIIIANGNVTANFLQTNLTPTIISPTASTTPTPAATLNQQHYKSSPTLTGAIPKNTLQLPTQHSTAATFTTSSINTTTSTFQNTSPSSASLAKPSLSSIYTTATITSSTTAIATTATTTTTPKKSTSSSLSSNDANGRSAALERAYVHDVYEHCEEPTGSLRPRVAQFLSNLEAGSVVCDVGCGSGRYLTQCNPSICTIGVDRCYRLSRVAKEKGGEVSEVKIYLKFLVKFLRFKRILKI